MVLLRKVLIEINEDFHVADKLNLALDSTELVRRLVQSCKVKGEEIRELASRAMLKVVNTEKGRTTIVSDKWWTQFYDLIFDSNATIRANGYGLYINLCEFTYGVESFYDCGILGDLVKQLAQEKDEHIMVLILTLLNILLDAEMVTRALLNSNVLELLNGHLTSRRWEIRQLAAENLGSISFNEAGKEGAI